MGVLEARVRAGVVALAPAASRARALSMVTPSPPPPRQDGEIFLEKLLQW